MSQRRSFESTPLLDEVIEQVREQMSHTRANPTLGEILDWIVRDIAWCEPDKPAYGQWSPVFGSIVRKALENHPEVTA